MTEAQKPKLVIEEVERDGGLLTKSVKTEDGKQLFVVNADFTEEQIYQVYNIANFYFNEGIKTGVARIQSDMKVVLGLTPPKETPAG